MCTLVGQKELQRDLKLFLGIMILLVIIMLSWLWNGYTKGFPGGSAVKNLPTTRKTQVRFPGLGRSPGGGRGYLLQYACLENPTDRGAWWATVHGVAVQTWLSDRTPSYTKLKDSYFNYLQPKREKTYWYKYKITTLKYSWSGLMCWLGSSP